MIKRRARLVPLVGPFSLKSPSFGSGGLLDLPRKCQPLARNSKIRLGNAQRRAFGEFLCLFRHQPAPSCSLHGSEALPLLGLEAVIHCSPPGWIPVAIKLARPSGPARSCGLHQLPHDPGRLVHSAHVLESRPGAAAALSPAGLFLRCRVMTLAMMKKPRAPSAKLGALLTKTCLCDGTGWTCELHSLRAMGHGGCREPGTSCRCNAEGGRAVG